MAAQPGETITITVAGGSAGATAVLTVSNDGVNTTYNPPAWTPLAGVYSFPYAEWIFESPEPAQGGMAVMPTLTPPGALFSSLSDSGGMSNVGPIQMQGNPNSQSVTLSSMSKDSFSAYSYNQ